MGRSVIPRYSAAQKKSPQMPQIVPKITIFLVFMNKTQILLFALWIPPAAPRRLQLPAWTSGIPSIEDPSLVFSYYTGPKTTKNGGIPVRNKKHIPARRYLGNGLSGRYRGTGRGCAFLNRRIPAVTEVPGVDVPFWTAEFRAEHKRNTKRTHKNKTVHGTYRPFVICKGLRNSPSRSWCPIELKLPWLHAGRSVTKLCHLLPSRPTR